MLTVGLILLLAAAAVAVDALLQNTYHLPLDLFGQHMSIPFWGLAVGGLVVGVAAAVGLAMAARGLRTSTRLRLDRRRMSRELARRPVVVEPVDRDGAAVYPDDHAVAPSRRRRGLHRARTGLPD